MSKNKTEVWWLFT